MLSGQIEFSGGIDRPGTGTGTSVMEFNNDHDTMQLKMHNYALQKPHTERHSAGMFSFWLSGSGTCQPCHVPGFDKPLIDYRASQPASRADG